MYMTQKTPQEGVSSVTCLSICECMRQGFKKIINTKIFKPNITYF